MIKLARLIEGKQVGTLYHFTSMDSFKKIMDSNMLKHSNAKETNPRTKKKENNISFTRDKRFGNAFRPGVNVDIALVIDGNKLSNNVKIMPFQFDFDREGMHDLPQNIKDEMEEKVWANEIKNIKNFITGIIINTKSKGIKRLKLDDAGILALERDLRNEYKIHIKVI
jgi:hypothetical protein